MAWSIWDSPLGPLALVGGEAGLRELQFPERTPPLDPADRDPNALRDVREQLEQYFAGERDAFDVELDLAGTAFRRRVWGALQGLPYGVVTTYGTLAGALGVRDSRTLGSGANAVTAAQKVAWAIAATPTPIIVPCHRVVGADGSLTGYRGGLWRKRVLLNFEAARATPPEPWIHDAQLALR
jgi:methylated-DNA-[protein]-cysteine S-methyltransferase